MPMQISVWTIIKKCFNQTTMTFYHNGQEKSFKWKEKHTNYFRWNKGSGEKSFGVMRPKLNFSATTIHDTFEEESTASDECYIIPTIKHWGGLLIFLGGCVSYKESGNLYGKTNAAYYYSWKICTHRPGRCAWDVLGYSNITKTQSQVNQWVARA